LAKAADPPSQHLRIEFKAFDMVADDRLLAELFHFVVAVALADASDLPGSALLPDGALHRRVARSGFDDEEVHREAARIVAVARRTARVLGYGQDFPLLEDMLATRRTPAHAMRERFQRAGTLFQPL
jgi:hypothetical protein